MTQDSQRMSPFARFVGATTEETSEGYVRMSLVIEERHTNPSSVMHGGVVTSLMEEALGTVVAASRRGDAQVDARHSTVEMNVCFLAGPRVGDEIVVEGRALKVGRSVAFGEAEVTRRGKGDLIAKGRFTFVLAAGAKS